MTTRVAPMLEPHPRQPHNDRRVYFMKSGMRRLTARLAATTLVGVVALSGATAAQAGTGWVLGTQLGTATVVPANGTDDLTPRIDTAGACDDAQATNSQLLIYGAGFPSTGTTVTANNPNSILPRNPAGGYSVDLQDSLANFAQAEPTP